MKVVHVTLEHADSRRHSAVILITDPHCEECAIKLARAVAVDLRKEDGWEVTATSLVDEVFGMVMVEHAPKDSHQRN